MKYFNIYILSLLLVFTQSCKDDKNGTYEAFFPDGTQKSKVKYKNGVKNGENIRWYKNGQKKFHQFYKNGKLNGKCLLWYKNGQLKSKVNYVNGSKEGEFHWWYENGEKQLLEYYKNNKMDGETTFWYRNGNICFKNIYKNGALSGKCVYKDVNGQIFAEGEHREGKPWDGTFIEELKGNAGQLFLYKEGTKKKHISTIDLKDSILRYKDRKEEMNTKSKPNKSDAPNSGTASAEI